MNSDVNPEQNVDDLPQGEFVLSLEELLPDDHGNIYISGSDGVSLRIVTTHAPTESGALGAGEVFGADAADGPDLHYYLFESGTKLIYDDHATLVLDVTG